MQDSKSVGVCEGENVGVRKAKCRCNQHLILGVCCVNMKVQQIK